MVNPKAKFEVLEYILFTFAVMLTILYWFDTRPINTIYIPNAVTGLATLSGILVVSIGFWLNYIMQGKTDFEEKWLGKRILVIVLLIALGLVLILDSVVGLVRKSLFESYTFAIFGTFIIILVLLEVIFLVVWKEITVHGI